MIRYFQGDIFASRAEALVNTVNTQGIMGKGLALQFKERFPENFRQYAKACKQGQVRMGEVFMVELPSLLDGTRYIINFPTKDHWRNKSRLEDIVTGLGSLMAVIQKHHITSVAIPPLGAGLGGLDWSTVRPEIEKACQHLENVNFLIYEPLRGKNPAPKRQNLTKPLTSKRLTLLAAFIWYINNAMSTTLTLVETQKIAYFLQEACGLDLNLRFEPWRYGPYAHSLTHVLQDMEGEYLSGFRDGTAKAFETLTVLPAAYKAMAIPSHALHTAELDKFEQWVSGFEDPISLELLATIHWLAHTQRIPLSLDAMLPAIHNWCDNKDWGARKAKYFPAPLIAKGLERIHAFL